MVRPSRRFDPNQPMLDIDLKYPFGQEIIRDLPRTPIEQPVIGSNQTRAVCCPKRYGTLYGETRKGSNRAMRDTSEVPPLLVTARLAGRWD